MATSTTNGLVTPDLSAQIEALSDVYVKSLVDGARWGPLGDFDGTTLSYSFPREFEATAAYYADYGVDYPNEWEAGWRGLSASQRASVQQALDIYAKVAALSFSPIEEHPSLNDIVGELRFAVSDAVAPAHAYAYTPGPYPEAGDVWFSPSWYGASTAPGSYGFLTILHETGHALGLAHPFEGSYRIPLEYDSFMYTIMSYDAVAGDPDSYADRYPSTPMRYDIEALEWLYGKSLSANLGNSVYTFSGSGKYWQTLLDSGGVDTIEYDSASGARISLVGGDFCTLGQPIVLNGSFHDYRTVWLGPSTIVERAIGGEGADIILGNPSANRLTGNGGNDDISGARGDDSLYGNAGADRLNGGRGHDSLSGGGGADAFVFNSLISGPHADRIADFNPALDLILLDDALFTALGATGALAPSSYCEAHNVDDVGATQPGQRILYDLDSGKLYYDADGSDAGGQLLVARLTGSPDGLSAADIIVT